jgi:hypothetical protein
MKKSIAASVLTAFMSLLLVACGGGGGGATPNVGKGSVDFVVSAAAERTKPAGLQAIASENAGIAGPSAVISANVHNVRVVVKNSANVSTSYTLGLSSYPGPPISYLSQQLSLEVGNYTLETYEVRDAANNVLYATPLTGSSAASAVSAGESLPKAMTVTLNGPNQVTPQIVSTANQTPASFGFAAFGFNLQESITFQVGAYTMANGAATRVSADVLVTVDGTQVYSGNIANPVVASITIGQSANASAVYSVTVNKSGFQPYVLSGQTAAQLRSRVNGNSGGIGIIDALMTP